MSEWQNMASAPIDGTLIIALTDSHQPVFVRWWPALGYGDAYPWVGHDHSAYREDTLLWWMPIPPIPSQENSDE